MMKVLLTHPGTQYSHALAVQLFRQNLLYRFVTGLAIGQVWWAPILMGMNRQFQTRFLPQLPNRMMVRIPGPELNAIRQLRECPSQQEFILHKRNQDFQNRIPQSLINHCDIVIGFDTSSWILIERLRPQNKPFVLDASIAHPKEKEKIYKQLRNHFPAWAEQSPEKDGKLIELEEQELSQCHTIVAASSFTRNSYLEQGVAANKIQINPYGIELSEFTSKWQPMRSYAPPKGIRFVFMGKISARKGIPWLLEVWHRFVQVHPTCTLVLAGNGQIPDGVKLPQSVTLHSFIQPAFRQTFLHQYDVFVFPSFFEGFGQVIIEAMACGLPVVTTTHTAGPDIIDSGKDGFVIEPGDDKALFNALDWIASNPQSLRSMGEAAAQKAAHYTWNAYGHRWKNILDSVIEDQRK